MIRESLHQLGLPIQALKLRQQGGPPSHGLIDSLDSERVGIGSEKTMRRWEQVTKHVSDHRLAENSLGHKAVNLSPGS